MIERYNDIRKAIRDIQLTILDDPKNIKLDPTKRFNRRFRILMPNRKLIRTLIKEGAILTGSRALKCYSINNKPFLDRKMSDWDFMTDRKTAFKIAAKHNLDLKLSDTVISIKNQRWWAGGGYTESYQVGPVNVNIIITDDLPNFQEKDGIRFTSPTYILSEKIKLIESNPAFNNSNPRMKDHSELHKHIKDLEKVIVNFYGNIW